MNHHASPPPIPLITIRPRVGQRTVKKIDTPTIKVYDDPYHVLFIRLLQLLISDKIALLTYTSSTRLVSQMIRKK